MLPEKVSVTATLSVISTGAHYTSAVASVKENTCYVKAEQKLIGMPILAGRDGSPGTPGNAATVTVGTVTTLPAGSNATVVNSGTENAAVLDFGIPKGYDGEGSGGVWGFITGDIEDQTDLQSAMNGKADTADLGNLAFQDTADYTTDVTNKPILGSLASKNTADYATDVTNKPTLGTMSAVNDAPSDGSEYVRKNGAWSVASGGSSATEWGDIDGTLSDQTDLQEELDAKSDLTNLAEIYDSTQTYQDGDVVVKDGKLWRKESVAFPLGWEQITVLSLTPPTITLYDGYYFAYDGALYQFHSEYPVTLSFSTASEAYDILSHQYSLTTITADEYDPEETYDIGDFVENDGDYYKKTSEPDEWEEITVDELIKESGGGGVWGSITGTLSDQTDLASALADKAPLASPALTGTPTAPTASQTTTDTQIATTAFVSSHDPFFVTGNASAGTTVTLTDSRIVSDHWQIPPNGIYFGTPGNVRSDVSWSTNNTNHTVTLTGTFAGATTVKVEFRYYQ